MNNKLMGLIFILLLSLILIDGAQTPCIADDDLVLTGTVSDVLEHMIFIENENNGFIFGTTSQVDDAWINTPRELIHKSVTITYCMINGVNYILSLTVDK